MVHFPPMSRALRRSGDEASVRFTVRRIVSALAALVAAAAIGGMSAAGDGRATPGEPVHGGHGPADLALEPGPAHAAIDALAGRWRAKVVFWPFPGADPSVSSATATTRWILDGRFLETAFASGMGDLPFEALQILGHDNVRERYVLTWMDSSMTSALFLTGRLEGERLTLEGERPLPGGASRPFRMVFTLREGDGHDVELFEGLDGRDPFRFMRIEYRSARVEGESAER